MASPIHFSLVVIFTLRFCIHARKPNKAVSNCLSLFDFNWMKFYANVVESIIFNLLSQIAVEIESEFDGGLRWVSLTMEFEKLLEFCWIVTFSSSKYDLLLFLRKRKHLILKIPLISSEYFKIWKLSKTVVIIHSSFPNKEKNFGAF